MDGLYWLISLLVVAGAIALYARYWYYRPSGMPEALIASYSYQALGYIDFYARRQGQDPTEYEINMYRVVEYLKSRKLAWRQRNDIIGYMKKVNWIYGTRNQGAEFYVMTGDGMRELQTPDSLRGVVREAAQELHDEGIGDDQAKAAAAAIIAAALRVDARSAPPESSKRAKDSADEIEEAVKTRDLDKIDRAITRTRDILQIVTYSLPFARDILHILGSL